MALKVLPERIANDPESRERFEREARAAAALNHPNIVTIHSVEEADGRLFLTMELVEGRTLADLIPADGLPLDRILTSARRLPRRSPRRAAARHHAPRSQAGQRDGDRGRGR